MKNKIDPKDPRCPHCGKPVISDSVIGLEGTYHRICTEPSVDYIPVIRPLPQPTTPPYNPYNPYNPYPIPWDWTIITAVQ